MNQKIIKSNSIKNYFDKLAYNEYVKNDSPICVFDLADILTNLYLEIKNNYKGSLVNFISLELKIKAQRNRTFYHWLKREYPIPGS